MIKKLLLIFFLVFISGCSTTKKTSIIPTSTPSVKSAEEIQAKVSVSLDFGGGKTATYSNVLSKTAYESLQKIALENNIKVEVKKYDFGTIVNSINGKANSKNLSWIYYVNGKSPDVGADKYQLKEGDKVEWKYEKPTL